MSLNDDLAFLRWLITRRDGNAALDRVEAVIEAARQADLCPLPEPYRSNFRAALAALDEGGET